MTAPFGWFRQIVLTLGACFFLLFGIQVLISAFGMADPLSFMMTFFSSTLMILISAAILAGLVYRMISSRRRLQDPSGEGSSPEEPAGADGCARSGNPEVE